MILWIVKITKGGITVLHIEMQMELATYNTRIHLSLVCLLLIPW